MDVASGAVEAVPVGRVGCGVSVPWGRDFLSAVALERELHCCSPRMCKDLLLLTSFCHPNSSMPKDTCWARGQQGVHSALFTRIISFCSAHWALSKPTPSPRLFPSGLRILLVLLQSGNICEDLGWAGA